MSSTRPDQAAEMQVPAQPATDAAHSTQIESREALDDVVDQLLAVAERVRRAAREHDLLTPLEELARARNAAAHTVGTTRALYEVAEAFLFAFDRGDFGTLGMELARFVREHEVPARSVLYAASTAAGLPCKDVPPDLTTAIDHLIARGALREIDGTLRVRPSVRSAVAELVDPPLVRMWRLVERARRAAAMVEPQQRVEHLAGRLGIDPAHAREILATKPIAERRLGRGLHRAPSSLVVGALYEAPEIATPADSDAPTGISALPGSSAQAGHRPVLSERHASSLTADRSVSLH